MTLNESKELESIDHVPTKCDYNAVDDDGTDMIKYHVNFSYTGFQETLSMFRFGGNLSIQKPIGSKVVMYVGQDEAIVFEQFLFSNKMWVGPSGQRPFLSKDKGSGTMVSAFVLQEHSIM